MKVRVYAMFQGIPKVFAGVITEHDGGIEAPVEVMHEGELYIHDGQALRFPTPQIIFCYIKAPEGYETCLSEKPKLRRADKEFEDLFMQSQLGSKSPRRDN